MKSKEYYKFEDDFISTDKLSLKEKFRLLNCMYRESLSLGAITSENILEGLEKDIKLAKKINSVRKTS